MTTLLKFYMPVQSKANLSLEKRLRNKFMCFFQIQSNLTADANLPKKASIIQDTFKAESKKSNGYVI